MTKDISLSDVFSEAWNADAHARPAWKRDAVCPTNAARMIEIIWEAAKQHHQRFETQYAPYQLELGVEVFRKALDAASHQFTGGLRPTEQLSLKTQKMELLRLNVNHVCHEIYCRTKRIFRPFPSIKRFSISSWTVSMPEWTVLNQGAMFLEHKQFFKNLQKNILFMMFISSLCFIHSVLNILSLLSAVEIFQLFYFTIPESDAMTEDFRLCWFDFRLWL